MPLNDPTLFYHLLGPYSTRAAVRAYVGVGTGLGGDNYIDHYEATEPTNYSIYGSQALIGNAAIHQYDMALRYYAFYAMNQDEAILTKANALAVGWRDGYPIASSYLIQMYLAEMRGLALHYAATGDTVSQTTLGKLADVVIGDGVSTGLYFRAGQVWKGGVVGNGITPSTEGHDIRTWVRGFELCLYAKAISAPSPGVPGASAGGNDHGAYATGYLNAILGAQYPDGGWRSTDSQLLIGGSGCPDAVYDPNTLVLRTFYNNLACNAMLDYLRLIGPDARIMPAILACMNYIYTTTDYGGCWDTTTVTAVPFGGPGPASVGGGWPRYIQEDCGFPDTPNCASGTPEKTTNLQGSSSLCGLMLRATGALYQYTGDTVWKTRANQLIAGMSLVDVFDTAVSKLLNESYSTSFNVFPDLIATPGGGSPSPSPTRTIRLRGV